MFRQGIRSGRGRKVSLVIAVGALAAGAMLIAGPAASASGSGFSITDVRTTPTTVSVGEQLTTDIDFIIANGTPAGETTELTLPSALVALPAGFDVQTSDGSLVATAAISSGSPAVITFTTTDYAKTHVDVHGTAFVQDNFDATVAKPGATTPLIYTSNGESFTSQLTVSPGSSIDRAGAFKFGQFVNPDQGSSDPMSAIYWFIESPVAPAGGWSSLEFTDVIPAGQSIECSSVKVSIGDGSGPGGGFADGTGFGPYSFKSPCSTAALDLLTGPVPEGKIIRVQFTADLASPTGSTKTSFENKATVIEKTVSGGTKTYPASGTLVQSSAGGSAVGSNPAPTTSTTPTPTTVATPTTPPTTATTPTPTPTTTTATTPTTTATSTTPTPTTATATTPTTASTPATAITPTTPTTVVVLSTSRTETPVTTATTTPMPVSPSLSSPVSTTSDGTTIEVMPTSDSLAPATTSTSTNSVTTSVISTTTPSAVLASTGAPVKSAAIAGFLLLFLGSGLLMMTVRRRSRNQSHQHS